MVDGYTKAVLTVIAASLSVIAAGQVVGRADAQMNTGCGNTLYAQQPCEVRWSQPMPVKASPY